MRKNKLVLIKKRRNNMPRLMSIKLVAPMLNISEVTLRRLIKKQEIGYYRVGKRYLFNDANIQEYLSKTAVPMR
jgi:excisionase family DNA binding protein